jgi:hypothetical protein
MAPPIELKRRCRKHGTPGRYCARCERDHDIDYALAALPLVALAFALTALLTSALSGWCD